MPKKRDNTQKGGGGDGGREREEGQREWRSGHGQGREPEEEKEGEKNKSWRNCGAGRRWEIFLKRAKGWLEENTGMGREKDRKDDMEGVGKVFEEMEIGRKRKGFF